MNPLPPQAYTKETLTQAFAWLQTQPDNIKEIATTPDILVSLYLKTKMQGEGVLDRPSIQNFKNDLRSLAGMMGEFENLSAPAAQVAMPTPKPAAPRATPPSFQVQHSLKQSIQELAPPAKPIATESFTNSTPAELKLDSRTLATLNEVRLTYNLSSDIEALRLLVSIGQQHLQKVLK